MINGLPGREDSLAEAKQYAMDHRWGSRGLYVETLNTYSYAPLYPFFLWAVSLRGRERCPQINHLMPDFWNI